MNEGDSIKRDDNKRTNIIIALYNQAMEDIRDRRRVEWQTFAVVNVVYLGLLKVLYDYKCALTLFQAIMITIAASPILDPMFSNSQQCSGSVA